MNIEDKEEFDNAVNNEFNERAEKTTEADGKKAVENESKIKGIVSKVKVLAKFVDDVAIFFLLLKDYFSGRYKNLPWKVVAAIITALLYVLSPIDLIPDLIPGVGYLDDAAVLALCLKLVKLDVDKYAKWRKNEDGTIDV